MWLLNAETRRPENFVDESQLPGPYAILSHTWGNGEVSFVDVHHETAKSMEGYRKLDFACNQALKDEIMYVWIDTCCIDKRSSAELSEAITHDRATFISMRSSIAQSRWFTRGWTLQELIAPRKVEFYDNAWIPLGLKAEVVGVLSEITGISVSVLSDRDQLFTASTAQKMAWAAGRQTSRPEDQAYALLGLFDVNMPLLYGEGSKAFMRLQEALISTGDLDSRDHSVLAWHSYRGDLLAPSPAYFERHDIVSWTEPRNESFELTRKGLRLTLLVRADDQPDSTHYWSRRDLGDANSEVVTAVLNCQYEDMPSRRIALRLRRRPHITSLANIASLRTQGEVVYDRLPDLTVVDERELEGFIPLELTIARKPFTWPQMPLKVFLSLSTEARIMQQWPWNEDRDVAAWAHTGGEVLLHPSEQGPEKGYSNLLVTTLEEEQFEAPQALTLGIRIDRASLPPKLFLGSTSANNLSCSWPDHTLRVIRAGETHNLDVEGACSFEVEASYVLQRQELLWHLKLSIPSKVDTSTASIENTHQPAVIVPTANPGQLPEEMHTDLLLMARRIEDVQCEMAITIATVKRELEQLHFDQQKRGPPKAFSFLQRAILEAGTTLKKVFASVWHYSLAAEHTVQHAETPAVYELEAPLVVHELEAPLGVYELEAVSSTSAEKLPPSSGAPSEGSAINSWGSLPLRSWKRIRQKLRQGKN